MLLQAWRVGEQHTGLAASPVTHKVKTDLESNAVHEGTHGCLSPAVPQHGYNLRLTPYVLVVLACKCM